MAQRYSAGGRTVATAAVADEPAAVLWNASTVKTIYCNEVSVFIATGVAYSFQLIRTSTRGTPGSTVTPDIDNDRDRLAAPGSTAKLDLAAFTSTLPTVQGPPLARANTPGVIGSGSSWIFSPPIAIPQSTGLAIANVPATASPTLDVTFVWDE